MSSYLKLSSNALEVFKTAVRSVSPTTILRRTIELKGDRLTVDGRKYVCNRNAYVVGFGKAVYGMGQAVQEILGDHIVEGILSVPVGIESSAHRQSSRGPTSWAVNSRIRIIEGAENNLPDSKSHQAANEITELVSGLNEHDLLIVLISGGGSALLPLPIHPVTVEEICQLTKELSMKGATIQQLNAVRKRLSRVKGGKLALMAAPATVISLVMSDVMGDPLDLIAGGPCVYNSDHPQLAINILEEYQLIDCLPSSIVDALKVNDDFQKPEDFDHVRNTVIANNTVALKAAAEEAAELGYESCILTSTLAGDAKLVGQRLYEMINSIVSFMGAMEGSLDRINDILKEYFDLPSGKIIKVMDTLYKTESERKDLCLILGGETTVKVKGTGLGGRNQELALSCASSITSESDNWLLLSAGTDGIDGPTDAAGAIVNPMTSLEASRQGLEALKYLDNNDSYSFFSKLNDGEYLVKTGHTGTNVMDVVVILIQNL